MYESFIYDVTYDVSQQVGRGCKSFDFLARRYNICWWQGVERVVDRERSNWYIFVDVIFEWTLKRKIEVLINIYFQKSHQPIKLIMPVACYCFITTVTCYLDVCTKCGRGLWGLHKRWGWFILLTLKIRYQILVQLKKENSGKIVCRHL